MLIAYVLYPDFTALDLVGPYEIISRWPDARVHFVARSLEPVRCDRGLTVLPTDTPETLPDPDLIVVPGSENPVPVMSDEVLVEWLRTAAPGCRWTASVCTGAYMLAEAGLLHSRRAATHWAETDRAMLKRINRLIDDVTRHPFTGIGKPEPLRHSIDGAWSRRIDAEHRLVYLVSGDAIIVLQCRYHY